MSSSLERFFGDSPSLRCSVAVGVVVGVAIGVAVGVAVGVVVGVVVGVAVGNAVSAAMGVESLICFQKVCVSSFAIPLPLLSACVCKFGVFNLAAPLLWLSFLASKILFAASISVADHI